MSRVLTRLLLTACALLALRWPLPVFWSTLRGEGAVDGPIAAFLASFLLGLLGLPGFLAALWSALPSATCDAPWWMRLGLLATVAGSVTTAGWIAISVREIGTTLEMREILLVALPVAVTAIAAVMLRKRCGARHVALNRDSL